MADSLNFELDSVRILIDRVRCGERNAHPEFVDQIQSYVGMMANQKLDREIRAHVAPSDIVQQTMIQMIAGIDQFAGDSTEEFFGWLNRIIQNKALKSRRDLTRQKRNIRRQKSLGPNEREFRADFEPEQRLLTPQSNAMATERIEIFHQALSKLTADDRTVIRLRSLDQLSFTDIAHKVNRTKDSVSSLWYRAVVKFKKELEALDDDSRQQ